MDVFSSKIIKWYQVNGRNLPWRETADPYKIWISEIILQQTRVAQGYEYYRRFIARFPDVEVLAAAEEVEVMSLWQGLGYYSRARNLHQAAKQVVAQGMFPLTYDTVKSLKGVGDYTAAAICSFAYGLPCAVVDGNVYRVLSRWLGVDTPIDTAAGKKEFAALADQLLDKEQPAMYNQAIMDFGAMVCTPSLPRCEHCPLADSCVALSRKQVDSLPCKAHKTKVTDRYFHYLYIHTDTHLELCKRGEGDIWQSLYEFPLVETEGPCEPDDLLSLPSCKLLLDKYEVLQISLMEKERKHILSHRRVFASCYDIKVKHLDNESDRFQGIAYGELNKFPVSNLVSHFFSLILKRNHKINAYVIK